MRNETLPAESDQPCGCCGRYHRKLVKVDGIWMGKTCAEQYNMYKFNKDITSLVWRGYEKQFKKIAAMFGK